MPLEEKDLPAGGTATVADAAAGAQQSQQSTNADAGTTAGDGTPPAGGSQGTPAGDTKTKVDDKPKSALDAVLKVMKPAASAPAAPAIGDKKDEKAAEPTEQEHKVAGEGEKDWISRDEYAKLAPVVRRRITNLTSQRNEARDQVKSFEPKAKTYDDLVSYCNGSKVSSEDFQYGLHIMGLVRTNPAQAWKELQPLINDLQAHVGEVLPADLAKEVDDGKISEERAKELAATRRERARLEADRQSSTENSRRETAERNYQDAVNKQTESIKTWEQTWKAADPDYDKKKERVWERMVTLLNTATEFGRKVLPPEETVKLAEQAKKDVEGWIAGLLPKPREIRPGPGASGGGGSSANTSTQKTPTSALEAARNALSKTKVAA